jgi:hypothetical protein
VVIGAEKHSLSELSSSPQPAGLGETLDSTSVSIIDIITQSEIY